MKTIAVEHLHPISEGELSRLDFAYKAGAQSNVHHKIPATQPLISLISPFISRIFQAGIYFALVGVRQVLLGATLNSPTNKIKGEK